MFHAVEGTRGAHEWAASGHDFRGLARTVSLMTVALIMIAASVCVLLGEKWIAVSPSLWSLAVDVCRLVTGLFGLLAVVSSVPRRRSESSREDIFGSIVTGVVFIAAAVAGLGLVIVITGLAGLVLLYASIAASRRATHR